jgi:Sensors of blue-light using FAD
MIRLTYASTALKEWSPEELLKLLKNCRTNNGAKNITGILLNTNGHFLTGVWGLIK